MQTHWVQPPVLQKRRKKKKEGGGRGRGKLKILSKKYSVKCIVQKVAIPEKMSQKTILELFPRINKMPRMGVFNYSIQDLASNFNHE